jgi:hypothetical protein
VATRLLTLRRKAKLDLAKFRARYQKDYKTARELEAAFQTGPGEKTENNIMQLEIKAELMDAVIGGYDDIVRAASREMSRRDSERSPRD